MDGTDEGVDVGRLTDEGNSTAAEVGGIESRGHGGTDAVDLAHVLAQPLEQGGAEDGLQGSTVDLLALQVALGAILLEGQRNGGLLLVVGRADKLRVAVGYLPVGDYPGGVRLSRGQRPDVCADVRPHVVEVAVAHQNKGVASGMTEEAVVECQHVGRLHLAVDDGIGHHAVGVVAPADEPAQLAVENALRRIWLSEIVFLEFVDGETADGGVETGLCPAQPQQLEHGLNILQMGGACHAGTHLIDQQAHRGRVAGEIMAQRLAREVACTAEADDAWGDDAREVVEAVEAVLSALAEGRERQTVVLGIATTEDDAGAVVEAQVGGPDLGDGRLADDVVGRLQHDQLVGHVGEVPVTLNGLLAVGGDEQAQVVLVGHLLHHLVAATQQEVLWTALEGLLDERQQ